MKKGILEKTMEQGRSMVEMLGVLAVVGLLSIVGVAGFRTAMNKHYANQTIDRLTRRALTISSQRLLGQTPSLKGFVENDGAYVIPNTGLEIKDADGNCTNAPQN